MKITRPRHAVFLLALAVLAFPFTVPAAEHWDPRHTWVFVVGLVKWKDKASFDSFPEAGRKDSVLLDVLKKRGVPESQTVYLKDAAATTASVQTSFAAFLKRPGPDDWVIVYFEGHGYKSEDDEIPYLATYDVSDNVSGWRFRAIPDAIERYFRGSHAIIALDNCYSGSMATEVKAAKRRVSYSVLASSMASQESTGNWTYTEALLSGFSGAPFVDLDHNGDVTLAEIAANAEQDMLFGEEQIATTAFTGSFDPETVMATAPPLSNPRVGERVEAYSVDDWYRGFIVDAKGGRFRVHYFGYEAADEEWVTAKNIRVPTYTSLYKVGEKVEVEYKRKWYPAHILNIKGGSHYVSYDDYDTDENEWVPTKRIRKIK